MLICCISNRQPVGEEEQIKAMRKNNTDNFVRGDANRYQNVNPILNSAHIFFIFMLFSSRAIDK